MPETQNANSMAEERYSYGQVYFDQKDYGQAADEFVMALEIEPGNPNTMLMLGRCCMEQEQYELALEWLEKTVEAAPHFADAHYLLGRCRLALDDRDRATDAFKETLNINPRFRPARTALSALLHPGGNGGGQPHQEDDAEARRANLHFHLGNALMHKNLLQEALAEYRAAVRLKPDYPDVRNKLGELYMKRGLFNLAGEEFRIAIKINPEFTAAQLNLAHTYLEHIVQLRKNAGELYHKILERDPRNAHAKNGLERIVALQHNEFENPERSETCDNQNPSSPSSAPSL